MPTILDIEVLNERDDLRVLVEENLKYSPEVGAFPFDVIPGTTYKTGVRTGLPSTGFRAAGGGQVPGTSTYKTITTETKSFGGLLQIPKSVAGADASGLSTLQAREGMAVVKSAMRNIGTQIWYGTTADADGFPGLKAATPFGGTTSAGDALTINAGGSTATTASSVYGVCFGEENIRLLGGNSKVLDISEWYPQQVVDPSDSTKYIPSWCADLDMWIGLQIASENCVRRICNLTEDSGKGLTDALIAKMIATLPVGYMFDALFMSRRSLSQLQASRTVTLFGNGRSRPDQETIAPLPVESNGIPIIVTDSILKTDAIES